MLSLLSQLICPQMPVTLGLISFSTLLGLASFITYSVYNLYFHPLSKFPGPLTGRAQDFWVGYHWIIGRWPWQVEALHERYGDIVRTAPNEISFSSLQSLKDIYGQTNVLDPKFFRKWPTFYVQPDSKVVPIGMEPDPVKHLQIRKTLAPAFSLSVLTRQEDIVLHYIDLFVGQLDRHGNTPEGADVTSWCLWLAFDIVNHLSFGESPRCVELGRSNDWIDMMVGSGFHVCVGYIVRRRFKLFQDIVKYCLNNKKSRDMRARYIQQARSMAARRLAKGTNVQQFDFFSHLISEKSPDASIDFLSAQAGTLAASGSETTATWMCVLMSHLLKNPRVMRRLQEELHAEFTDSSEIVDKRTRNCQYLVAVIEEGLRIFAPVPFGLPRICPGATIDGHWIPEGTIVATAAHVLQRDEKYFHKAKEFHPERWLPSDHPYYDLAFAADVKEASKPFGIGSRACIGVNLSYMETRLMVAKLVWNFNLEKVDPREDFERDARLRGLWKAEPFHVRFRPAHCST